MATSMKLRGVYNSPTWGLLMVPRSRPQCLPSGSQKAELPCEPEPPLPDRVRSGLQGMLLASLLHVPGRDSCCLPLGLFTASDMTWCQRHSQHSNRCLMTVPLPSEPWLIALPCSVVLTVSSTGTGCQMITFLVRGDDVCMPLASMHRLPGMWVSPESVQIQS